jgi:CelD/BcsL family acetyltransferase involved in cellulose biosynthesis
LATLYELKDKLRNKNFKNNESPLEEDGDYSELLEIAENGQYVENMFAELCELKEVIRKVTKQIPTQYLDSDWGIKLISILL